MKIKTIDRIIDYSLCYLMANWDDHIEDDLGISYENFIKMIQKWQQENTLDNNTNNK